MTSAEPRHKNDSEEPEGRPDGGVKSVQLTLDILEHISRETEIGVSDLATRLQSTKPTVYRHLQTLLERGYITQNSVNSRYRLGIRTYLLGQAAADRIDLLGASHEAMAGLVSATGQTAVLSRVTESGVTVLHTVLGKSSVEIGVRPGSALALHASAQGKVGMAFVPELSLRLQSAALERYTDFTITDPAVLGNEISLVKSRGWAVAPEELLLGLNSIGAPVFGSDGTCVATLAIVGSIQFVRRSPDPTQVQAVTHAARSVSRLLGLPEPDAQPRTR